MFLFSRVFAGVLAFLRPVLRTEGPGRISEGSKQAVVSTGQRGGSRGNSGAGNVAPFQTEQFCPAKQVLSGCPGFPYIVPWTS